MTVNHAEGYPHEVQLIGEGSWAAADRPDPVSQIFYAGVVAGVVDGNEQMDNLCGTRWRNSIPQVRSLLFAMVELATDSILRADVAESMALTSNELGVRRRPIQKSFIEVEGQGNWRSTSWGSAIGCTNSAPAADPSVERTSHESYWKRKPDLCSLSALKPLSVEVLPYAHKPLIERHYLTSIEGFGRIRRNVNCEVLFYAIPLCEGLLRDHPS